MIYEPEIIRPLDIQAKRYLVRYEDNTAFEHDAIRIETKTWPSDKTTTPVWFIVVTSGVVRQASAKEYCSLEAQYQDEYHWS